MQGLFLPSRCGQSSAVQADWKDVLRGHRDIPQPAVCPRFVRMEETVQIVSDLRQSLNNKGPPERARTEDSQGIGVNLGLWC